MSTHDQSSDASMPASNANQSTRPAGSTGSRANDTYLYGKEVNDMITDSTTAANLIAWRTGPLLTVGNNSTPLYTTPGVRDTASMWGVKSQIYTTWNCQTRSMVVGMVYSKEHTKTGLDDSQTETTIPEMTFLTSTFEIEQKLGRSLTIEERRFLKEGKGYNEQHGFLSRQKLNRYMTDNLKCHTSTSSDSSNEFDVISDLIGDTPDPPPEPTNTAYIYSDMVPVRAFNVSSWRSRSTQHEEPPYTTYYQALSERMNDPSASTALMSVVRGPTIRDTSSIIGLARYLKSQSESFRESAAMTRALCAAVSFDHWLYDVDPVAYKPIRNWVQDYSKVPTISISSTMVPTGAKILAVPLDVAVSIALNKMNREAPDPFFYRQMDSDWTMIPIRQTALDNPWSLHYIISFLDSAYWNGAVNWTVFGKWTDNKGATLKTGSVTMMPNANGVRIPGPRHAMIVLVDTTSGSAPRRVNIYGGAGHAYNVPVYTGSERAVQAPADLTQMWTDVMANANPIAMSANFASTYNEICTILAVGDACATALTAAAEAMLGAYPGVAMMRDPVMYSYNPTARGAWTFDGGYIDGKAEKIKSKIWPVTDFAKARQKLIGFNFSVQTPYHVTVTSATRVTFKPIYENAKAAQWYKYIQAFWSVNGLDGAISHHYSKYDLPTCTSLMRLSIYTGLISTHHQGYLFKSGPGVGNWLNMMGEALALSTSNFLSANDLSVRIWTGWQFSTDTNLLQHHMSGLQSLMTRDFLIWHNMSYFTTLPDWGWNCIDDYYDFEPTYIEWGNNSNWPFQAHYQWMEKLHLNPPMPNIEQKFWVTDQGVYLGGIAWSEQYKQWNFVASSTIDFHRYQPVVNYHIVGTEDGQMPFWIDRWSYDSSAGGANTLDPSMYISSVMLLSVNQSGYVSARNNFYFIENSTMPYRGDAGYVRMSPILYPDPPSLSSFLSGVRDYVLIPALAGLGAFITTGNPIAGAGVAATTIAQAAGARAGAAQIRKAGEEAVKNVEQKLTQGAEKEHILRPQTAEESASTGAQVE